MKEEDVLRTDLRILREYEANCRIRLGNQAYEKQVTEKEQRLKELETA